MRTGLDSILVESVSADDEVAESVADDEVVESVADAEVVESGADDEVVDRLVVDVVE